MTEASKTEAITQEDREAAASTATKFLSLFAGTFARDFPERIRAGVWDEHWFVQAFARHRLATEARNPANHPDQATDDYVLPCDVHLPIATVIKAGCTLQTLKLAMEADYRPRHFEGNSRAALPLPTPSTDGVVVPRARYERLLFAAGEIDSDPDLASASGKPVSVLQSAIEPAREFIPPAAPSAPVVDQREPE